MSKQQNSEGSWGLREMNDESQNEVLGYLENGVPIQIGSGDQADVYQHPIYEDIAIVNYKIQELEAVEFQEWREGIVKIIKGQNSNQFPLIIRTFGMKEQMESKRNLTQSTFQKSEQYSMMIEIAQGVKQLHDASIVHRDLKPENIFVMEDGINFHVKIGDIGLVKVISKNSPASKLEEKSKDIYSLGLVFIFILFKDKIQNFNVKELLNCILSQSIDGQEGMKELIQQMIKLRPQINQVIEQLITQCQKKQNANENDAIKNGSNSYTQITEKRQRCNSNVKEKEDNDATQKQKNLSSNKDVAKMRTKAIIKQNDDCNSIQKFQQQQQNVDDDLDVQKFRSNQFTLCTKEKFERQLRSSSNVKEQEDNDATQKQKNQSSKMRTKAIVKQKEDCNSIQKFQKQQQNVDDDLDVRKIRSNKFTLCTKEKFERQPRSNSNVKDQEDNDVTQQQKNQQSNKGDALISEKNRKDSSAQRTKKLKMLIGQEHTNITIDKGYQKKTLKSMSVIEEQQDINAIQSSQKQKLNKEEQVNNIYKKVKQY